MSNPAPAPGTDAPITEVTIEASPDVQTRQLQAAIDQVAAAGGGIVRLASGTHRSATLHLRCRVELNLQKDAVLLAHQDIEAYPIIDSMLAAPGHVQALVTGDDLDDVAITGPGTIAGWGNAQMSWHTANTMGFRPALVYLRNSRRVRIENLTLCDSVFWTCHLRACQDVVIQRVTIRNGWPNSDGIDPDGCRNVVIRNCDIDVGDDCICLKSVHGEVCENIHISDCRLRTSCAALKVGTEAVGDIRDVRFERCKIQTPGQALAIFLKDTGHYANIRFSDIEIDAVNSQFPIVVDVTPRNYRDASELGTVRNVTFERIALKSPGRIYIEGHPTSPIDGLVLSDVTIQRTGPLQLQGSHKPIGGARGTLDPDRDRYCGIEASIVLIHVKNDEIQGVTIDTQSHRLPEIPLIARADGSVARPRT